MAMASSRAALAFALARPNARQTQIAPWRNRVGKDWLRFLSDHKARWLGIRDDSELLVLPPANAPQQRQVVADYTARFDLKHYLQNSVSGPPPPLAGEEEEEEVGENNKAAMPADHVVLQAVSRGALSLDIGCGYGEWFLDRAAAEPETLWIGVDVKLKRALHAYSNMMDRGLDNVRVLCMPARQALALLPMSSVQAVHVNYPDPWPRKRDHKHRIIQQALLHDMARCMGPGAVLTTVTDSKELNADMVRQVLLSGHFDANHPHPHHVAMPEAYGASLFAGLTRELGFDPLLAAFTKTEMGKEEAEGCEDEEKGK